MVSKFFDARLSRRGLLACAGMAGLVAAAGPAVARQASPHALIDFFVRDPLRGVALSPSGEKIAFLKENHEGETHQAFVEVFGVGDLTRPLSRTVLGEFEADKMEWANDERLLISLIQVVASDARVRSEGGSLSDERITMASRRMISLDTVNGGAAVLFENQRGALAHAIDLGRIVDLLPDDPDHILMLSWESDRPGGVIIQASEGVAGLYRVNVNTGHAERIERGGPRTVGWHTQAGVPVLRIDVNERGTVETLYSRPAGSREWQTLTRRRLSETTEWSYVGSTDRPNVILVSARAEGEDVASIRELDVTTRQYGPPMATREGRDIEHGVLDDRGVYLGGAYYDDRIVYTLADSRLNAQHRALNGFLGNTHNVRFADVSRDHNRLLINASGPQDAGSWYLYDIARTHIDALGSRTRLDPARLSATEAVDVPTRDGQTIRAYVTGPLHGRPGPVVALIHGGPELRDTQDFNYQVQILASQGWWVVQPNFRGSGGYGQAFAQSGWREWGGKMQTDVEDAVAHAIQLKGLDASKVAIMGTSYGGYAALMGAVLRPDLYKAAIGIAGDYDLVDLLNHERDTDDTPDNFVFGVWSNRIGDLQRDRALIEAASPRRRVNEITCPVLLVHGEWDQIVPITQSERMEDALRGAGKSVDFVRVRNAGHGDWVGEVDMELWRRYIAFLQRAFA